MATIHILENLHDSVNIISPNYTSSANLQNQTCYWRVKIETNRQSPNNTFKVVFNYFDLEYSPDCSKESLNFYNAYSGNLDKQLLGAFCGTTHPEVLYVSHPDITFQFKLGQRSNFKGFSLTITVVPKGEFLTDMACTKTRNNETKRAKRNHRNDILVPRAYDPSGLRQESRALGATILK